MAAWVRRRTGLVFGETRQAVFTTAVTKAMQRAGCTNADAFVGRLEAEQSLLDDLVAEITVGETYFFRDAEQFAALREEIFPQVAMAMHPGATLRVWSAGCASGEEPYSLAIVLRDLGLMGNAHVLGTDLCRGALARARRARYGPWSLRAMPEESKARYFETEGRDVSLLPSLQHGVEFHYLNLADDAFPSMATGIWGMDVILCRNVLIYFDAETVARVAHRLIASLADDGWLLLGASDPAISRFVACDVVTTRGGLAYRRPANRLRPEPRTEAPPPARLDTVTAPGVGRPSPTGDPPPPKRGSEDERAELARCYEGREYDRVVEIANRVLQDDGDEPAVWIALVRALANRGERDAAGRACAAALDRHGASAELSYLHAVLLVESTQPLEAAAAARRAIYLDRKLVVGHLVLGTALARSADIAGAQRAFRNALSLLAARPVDEIVAASDGEPAGRLAAMVQVQLDLWAGTNS